MVTGWFVVQELEGGAWSLVSFLGVERGHTEEKSLNIQTIQTTSRSTQKSV